MITEAKEHVHDEARRVIDEDDATMSTDSLEMLLNDSKRLLHIEEQIPHQVRTLRMQGGSIQRLIADSLEKILKGETVST